MRYLNQLLIGIDQLLNTVVAGWADETFSARCFRSARRDQGKGRWVYAERFVNILFLWQDALVKSRGQWTGARHCERAWQQELDRRQYPPEYRA